MTEDPERAGKTGDDAMWKNLADDASLIDIFKHIVDDGVGSAPAMGAAGDAALGPVWEVLEHEGTLADPDLHGGAGANGVLVDNPGSGLGSAPNDGEKNAGQRRSLDERGSGERGSGEGGGSGGGSGVGAQGGAQEASNDDGAGSAIPAYGYMRDFPKAASKLVRLRQEVGDVTNYKLVNEAQFDAKNLGSRIGHALTEMSEGLECGSLVQLFIPTVGASGTSSVTLSTSSDLARIKTVHGDKFRRYHEASRAFVFDVSPSSVDSTQGVPGRVFLYHNPEWTPSVCCYRPTEYLRLAIAIDCLVQSSLAFPVFAHDPRVEPQTQVPLGVVEIMLDTQTTNLGDVFDFVSSCARRHGMFTKGSELLASEAAIRCQIGDTLQKVSDTATTELENMCRSLGLPFAQCWLPSIEDRNRLVAAGSPFFVNDQMTAPYRLLSSQTALLPTHGPVGRAYDKGRMIWVDNVQEGSQADWPLQHAAALLGLRGVCACTLGLDSKDGGSMIEAVLEVFLPCNLTTSEQQQQSLDALWGYLQRSAHLHMLLDADGVRKNGGVPENLGGAGVGPSGHPSDPQNGSPNSGFPEGAFTGPAEGAAGDPRPPWGVTLEMLQQHFNKHLKEAAKDLGVGSTTLKRICRHFGIARWPRRSLKSKQGKLNNALKTLSAYGGNDPGGSMHGPGGSIHGGSMMTGLTGTTTGTGNGNASMMSLGAPNMGGCDGTGLDHPNVHNDPWDAQGRGQSVHGPLAGVQGSGNFGAMMADHFVVPAPGQPMPMGSIQNPNSNSRGDSVHGGSHHGGTEFPFPTHSDDDRSGSPNNPNVRGQSARGGGAFNGSDYGGSSRGASTRGGNQLLGMKRQVGDPLLNGTGTFFQGNGNLGGFAAPPDGKRGASWHGGTAAAAAMNDEQYQGRMEKTSHGGNFAFAHMSLGNMVPGMSMHHGGNTGGRNSPRSPGSMAGGSHHGRNPSFDNRTGGTATNVNKDPSGSGGSGGGGESFLADRPSDAVTCKIVYGDDIVRMTLTGDMGLGHVVDRLVSSVDTDAENLRLRYQDEEGEWCALNTDADLQECRVVTNALGGSIRIQASAQGK